MRTFTASELADILRATPDQATELLESGQIPYFMLGDEVRIEESAIRDFIKSQANQRSVKTTVEVLMGNQVWRNLLKNEPELNERLKREPQRPGSFGSLLRLSIDDNPEVR